MLRILGWSVWAVLPILALAFHFGPGQQLLNRDQAVEELKIARQAETDAERLQAIAYETQFATLSARRDMSQQDNESSRENLERLLKDEQDAYAAASDAWKLAADRYQNVEALLDGSKAANQIRWLKGRALVRSGEVFNGIEELQATLYEATSSDSTLSDAMQDQANVQPSSNLATAAREELAAAHYYAARLLREEGRSADVWREVSETSRQQFRYLAEKAVKQTAVAMEESATAQNLQQSFQQNLERVLDLEQQDRSELVGRPIPKDSPRARRPGDGEPGKRPGIGPRPGDRPGNGASGMMEIGDGW